MDNFQAKFIEEATDLIASLEKALLELEHNTGDKSLVEKIFRVMHTLKGNSSMFGFEEMGSLTHHLETIYVFVREGKRTVTKELLTVTLTSVDHLKLLLSDPHLSDDESKAAHEKILANITQLISEDEEHIQENTSIVSASAVSAASSATYQILFKPKERILLNGTNPLYLLDELHQMGKCKVIPRIENIPPLTTFTASLCYTFWDIYLVTKEDVNAIKDVFIFVEDDCLIEIHKVGDGDHLLDEAFLNKIQEKKNSKPDLIAEISRHNNSGKGEKAKKESEGKQPVAKEQTASSIRVASDKLDELMNLVSELVTTQARLSLLAENTTLPDLLTIAENVEKLSRQLRDNTFNMCLVPLETMLTRFQRLVRDLSVELNKDIIFLTEGAETELDKSIIDNLTDPLLHILRNSIDHGIEAAPERLRKGKPSQGKIILKAFYSGTNVHIQVQDDGAGIDRRRIREKALSKGIISAETQLSDKEILDLIFLPGFSTASKVTDVSGRGVGMDVVKRKIADIRGEIEVQSKADIGTTIIIKLPLTLSIIDGLLVKIEDTPFVIPLAVVDKCYEATHSQLANTFNNLITLDGEKVPFFYLRNELSIAGTPAGVEQIVVIKFEDKRVGFTVDAIVGEYQAVLKPLGKLYKSQELISGATILGDGTIALVMDTNKMIKLFSKPEIITATI